MWCAIGDARRALELVRRAVQLAWNAKLKAAKEAAAAHTKGKGRGGNAAAGGASSSSGVAGAPAGAAAGVTWKPGDKAAVAPVHIGQAGQELSGSVHMQMLKGRSEWELMLLVGLVLESRATGKTAVSMQVGWGTLGSKQRRKSCTVSALHNVEPMLVVVLVLNVEGKHGRQ